MDMPEKGPLGSRGNQKPCSGPKPLCAHMLRCGAKPTGPASCFRYRDQGECHTDAEKKDGSYSSVRHSGRGAWAYALVKAISKRNAPMARPVPRMDRIWHSARAYHARHRANARQRCRIVSGDHCRVKGKRNSGAPFLPGYVIFGGSFILSLRRNSAENGKGYDIRLFAFTNEDVSKVYLAWISATAYIDKEEIIFPATATPAEVTQCMNDYLSGS